MRWLLRLLVSEADRRIIDSELAELYDFRRRADGDAAAARWLRRQQLVFPLHVLAERVRAASRNGVASMPALWRDFTYSLRSLARTPTLALTVILTVGIGLGATTAMIAVVRAVVINPLPYANSDNLFWIYTDSPPFWFRFSVVDYRALEADHPTLSEIAAYQTMGVTITDGDSAERVNIRNVTGSYFPLLGQTPTLGRLFNASDDASEDRIAVLTHAYWTRKFGADPTVLGRTIRLNGESYVIVGVLQREVGPLERDMALFTVAHWPAPKRKGPFFTTALGRLKPGVSREAAAAAFRATTTRLFPIWKSSYQNEKATWGLQEFKLRVIRDIGSTLWLVLAAVGCVLLIACANAVNLLIARAVHRSRELTIRSALGASRARLFQHLIVESGTLALSAAVVGVGVSLLAISLVTSLGGDYIPRVDEVRLSGPVLQWLAILTAASGLLIFAGALVPVARTSTRRMDDALRSGSRSATDGPAARRLRRALVAAEFALATPLIIAAVLVSISLSRLSQVPVGVDTDRLLTGQVTLAGPAYADEAARAAFWKRALERLSGLPGVEAAALADARPPAEAGNQNNFDLEDRPAQPGQSQPVSTWVGISPQFFKTAGLRLLRGQPIDDRSLEQDFIVVDRVWANRFFPNQEVIGRRLKSGGCTTCPWTTVVGVVEPVKWVGLDATDDGTVYYQFVNMPDAYLMLRSARDPAALIPGLRQAIKELDAGLALSDIATGTQLVDDSIAAPRYMSVLIATFALAALILSIVGIYGVMAYFVQQHSRDIGIRAALGGEPGAIRRMVIGQGLRLAVVGVVVGVGVALIASRVVAAQLFEVSATDLRVMAGVPIALGLAAVVACLIPARRAARLDPAAILRDS